MPTTYDDALESFPDHLEDAVREAEAARKQLAVDCGLDFIVDDLARWPIGGSISVAFLGGSYDLHAKIAGVVRQVSDACGIEFDFGHDARDRSRIRSWRGTSPTESQSWRLRPIVAGCVASFSASRVPPRSGPARRT